MLQTGVIVLSVNLIGQKKMALIIFFSVGFFTFGVAQNSSEVSSMLVAKQAVTAPARGIASE